MLPDAWARTVALVASTLLAVASTDRLLAAPRPSFEGQRTGVVTPRPFCVSSASLRAMCEAGHLQVRESSAAPSVPHQAWVDFVVRGRESLVVDEHVEPARALPAGDPSFTVKALGPDAIANNRALSTCMCSGGRPLSQAEPSIAAWGPYVLASWNDRRNACLAGFRPSQGHAWSMDYGASFREGELLWGPTSTDAFHGDPTVAVNKKTGDFYISGILRRPSGFAGVVVVRGQFGPDSFTIDLRKVVGLGGADFYDKPWMAVDSISGNVYVTWTNFRADFTANIELQRLDRNLEPLGPVQQLTHVPYGASGPQGSYPTVGPDGELYVPYTMIHGDSTQLVWSDPSHLKILRSDDQGVTFGPIRTIAPIDYHLIAIPPGFQRGFYPEIIAIDIDRTRGPHRGRVYAVWAENRPLGGAAFQDTVVSERENNGSFATAQPIVPGHRVRGTCSGVEFDNYRFTGQRGQVFVCYADTNSIVPFRVRLLCSRDTSSVNRQHLLYARGPSGVGFSAFAAGLPYDGTYYLQFESPFSNFGVYRFATALVPLPAGAHARDIRDIFFAYSDDGATWSTPVRLNDDDFGFDSVQPQVVVDGRGRVHACWFDWRDDPECGTTSTQYGVSSGDGGVTWGPNRRLSDGSSFWGQYNSCSDNNQGDFTQMAADGDHVYAAFPDTRLGDPDVWVDASHYASLGSCPPLALVAPAHDLELTLSLANQGNFKTPLAWSAIDAAGWIAAVSPSAAGQDSVAPGDAITVRVTVRAPTACSGDSTIVRFVTTDPAIPGAADTCVTVVRCDESVPVLVSLVEKRVEAGGVGLAWYVQDAAGARATVLRKDEGADWIARPTPAIDPTGRIEFVDRDVPPGVHGYRLVIEHAEGRFENETWVEVPAAVLALDPVHPNPASRGSMTLDFSLPNASDASIELFDMSGRRVATRAVGQASPGPNRLVLTETAELADGIYLVVLRQGGRSISRKAVVTR